jgi:hypothetical protein
LKEIFKRLINIRKIAFIPQKPFQPPYPKWYNPNIKMSIMAVTRDTSLKIIMLLRVNFFSLLRLGGLHLKIRTSLITIE